MVPCGSRGQYLCARPLTPVEFEGCPKVSHTTGINEQRVIPKIWGLSDGP
jgi:hypothetical protein